jgi:TolB-like protein
MQYQKTDKPLSRIAPELGVSAVITGSVLRSGGRVRITGYI